MFKKIFIMVLVLTMLALSSCRVVDVIDHGTTIPEETTQPKVTEPWGIWYSYDACAAIELTQGSNKATLYSLAQGYYYEYSQVTVVDCIYDGNSTFIVTIGNNAPITFTFSNTTDNLMYENLSFVRMEKAPTEHPTYTLPNYAELNPASYVTVGEIDFDVIMPLVFEGAPYNLAMSYYDSVSSFPVAENINRPAQKGDYVKIDYCGKLDGVAFQGGTATGVSMLISEYQNKYIPGFIDGIIGHSVGETFDVDVTFPEDYHATDLAGKAVVFTMTLHSIYDLSLTDEAVDAFNGNTYKTYAEWLKDEQLAITEDLFADEVLKATSAKDPLPSDTYLYYYQQTMDYYHMAAYYYGMDVDVLMNYYGLNEMTVMQQSINQATYNMALLVLMEQNELSWTEEEFTAKYEEYVAKYLESNKDASQEDAKAYADGMKNQIELDLAEEKVLIWSFGMIFPSDAE